MGRSRWLASPLAAVLVVTLSATSAAAADAPDAGGTLGSGGVTVTLVTGDRVTITQTGDGRPTAAIEAARWPGRRVSFQTTFVDGTFRVVPSDVAPLVPATLDPALFDVTGLIRAGYDDAATAELPLIVRRGTTTTLAAGPLRSVRNLDSIAATAARDTSKNPRRFTPVMAS